MKLTLPEPSLVLLVGASGAGKSTFARRHFRPREILSSDDCRAWVSDDPANQAASADAFAVLYLIAMKRLAWGRLTVVDATNLEPIYRQDLLRLTLPYPCGTVAIVFDLPESLCQQQNQQRPDRQVPPAVIENQVQALQQSRPHLHQEGFQLVYTLTSLDQINTVTLERQPYPCSQLYIL